MSVKRKMVALVTTAVLTPYKAHEVFCVSETDAAKLLSIDKSKNDYGIPRNPVVKVEPFDPEKHGELLLASGSLNLADHNRLLSRLHPDRPPLEVRMTQYESEISNLLDEIDPERAAETLASVKAEEHRANTGRDQTEEEKTATASKAPEGGGFRARRKPTE